MRYLIVLIDLFSFACGFAGIGLFAFLNNYFNPRAFKTYLVFLLAFSLLLFHRNLLFFFLAFNPGALTGLNSWFYWQNLVLLTLFMAAYVNFYPTMTINPIRPLLKTVSWIIALLPFTATIVVNFLVKPDLQNQFEQQIFTGMAPVALSILLIISAFYYFSEINNSISYDGTVMMRIAAVGNLIFVPIFLIQNLFFYNNFTLLPDILNFYYMAVNASNIFLLARKKVFERPHAEEKKYFNLSDFSPREQEIIDLLVKGLGNKQIGAALNIEESTVKNHLYRIFKRCKVNSRVSFLLQLKQD